MKKLIEVVCNACWKIQAWRNQTNCIHCEKKLSRLGPQLDRFNRSLDNGGCYDKEGNP